MRQYGGGSGGAPVAGVEGRGRRVRVGGGDGDEIKKGEETWGSRRGRIGKKVVWG